ncbi:MAG: hypothetical protein R2720_00875 [Candidatus Nanopelagicales bacterium]
MVVLGPDADGRLAPGVISDDPVSQVSLWSSTPGISMTTTASYTSATS